MEGNTVHSPAQFQKQAGGTSPASTCSRGHLSVAPGPVFVQTSRETIKKAGILPASHRASAGPRYTSIPTGKACPGGGQWEQLLGRGPVEGDDAGGTTEAGEGSPAH